MLRDVLLQQYVRRRSDGQWVGQTPDAFLGNIVARLVAPSTNAREIALRFEDLLTGGGSPIEKHLSKLQRTASEPTERSIAFFRDVTDSDYDVAVSSNGTDSQIVSQLVTAFRNANLRVAWYRFDECRSGESAKVMKFMLELRRPPCVLLFLSDAYLGDDPENNWYCVWELADAILQISNAKRSAKRTLVVYADGQTVNSKNLDAVAVPVLRHMEDYFLGKYHELQPAERDTFKYYLEFSNHFHAAASAPAMARFFEERGTLGSYSHIRRPAIGQLDFSSIIRDVRIALADG